MEQSSDFGNPAHDAPGQGTDMQKALLSIRQARDSVLAQNHELISKLARADEELAVQRFGTGRPGVRARRRAEAGGEVHARVRRARASNAETSCSQKKKPRRRTPADRGAFRGSPTRCASATKLRSARWRSCGESSRPRTPPRRRNGSRQRCRMRRRKIADLEAQAEGFKAQQKKNIISLTKHLTRRSRSTCAPSSAKRSAALKRRSTSCRLSSRSREEASRQTGVTPRRRMQTERLEQHRLEIEELAAQLEATRIRNRELREALDGVRTSPEIRVAAPLPPEADEAITYDVSVALGCDEQLCGNAPPPPGQSGAHGRAGQSPARLLGARRRCRARGDSSV